LDNKVFDVTDARYNHEVILITLVLQELKYSNYIYKNPYRHTYIKYICKIKQNL